MLTGLLVATLAAEAGSAKPIKQRLYDALDFDRRAYYQICGDISRDRLFRAMQDRASDLSAKLEKKTGELLLFNYVDRRAKEKCVRPEGFEETITSWSDALNQIDKLIMES